MRLKDLLYCVKPVCFENTIDDFNGDKELSEQYPYGMRGSCFLVKYSREFFVITAKHNIDGRKLENVLVPYSILKRCFLPLKPYNCAGDHDIIIFQVEKKDTEFIKNLEGKDYFGLNIYPTSDLKGKKNNNYGLLFGFPKKVSFIDYTTKKLMYYGVAYKGELDLDKNILCSIEIDGSEEESKQADYNGLSGSPVFQVISDPAKANDKNSKTIISLKGMAIQTLPGTDILDFLNVSIIKDYLDKYMQNI